MRGRSAGASGRGASGAAKTARGRGPAGSAPIAGNWIRGAGLHARPGVATVTARKPFEVPAMQQPAYGCDV